MVREHNKEVMESSFNLLQWPKQLQENCTRSFSHGKKMFNFGGQNPDTKIEVAIRKT